MKSYVDLELNIESKDWLEYDKDYYDNIEFNVKSKDVRNKPPCVSIYRLEGEKEDLEEFIINEYNSGNKNELKDVLNAIVEM